ncbi:MAG: TlpA family protein disulfide reductase [Thiolinea sp.]
MRFFKAAALVFFLCFSTMVSAQQVQDFSFKDINGHHHRFSDYKGKWVIVNYWSTYCGPCIAELPALKRIAAQYKGRVVVLGMDAGETPDREMKQFIRQRGINYTVVPTQDSSMFALGLIYGVPTTFIVSPHGQIVDTHMGVITVQQMQRFVGQPPRRQQQRQTTAACRTVNGVRSC